MKKLQLQRVLRGELVGTVQERLLRARIAELEADLAHAELFAEQLGRELSKESARTAAEKLRADQMTEQHRMQCAMRRELEAALAVPEVLKDRETADLVNRLRDIAVKFHSSEQLRERIAAEIRPAARALAAPPAQNEPAAYLWQNIRTGRTRVLMPGELHTVSHEWSMVGPLYMGTPQPLPDVEIPRISASLGGGVDNLVPFGELRSFVRAIEAAHSAAGDIE